MVVAGRAAGGERVAEPEALLERDPVRDVREGGRALVGGHHEVGVVAVVAHDPGVGHDLAALDVVGQVEQPADEGLVAGHDLLGQVVAPGGRLLHHEPALRAHGHDHRVLHHLGLHQAEHLGTEVLAAIRPADAAACDRSAAQVHPLGARGVDEDLEARAGLGQPAQLRGVELERQVWRVLARARVEVVRAQHRPDHVQEHAQDLVLVEALDGVDRRLDALGHLLGVLAVGPARVEARLEQRDDQPCDLRVGHERLLHVAVAEREPRLAQVLADRPAIR